MKKIFSALITVLCMASPAWAQWDGDAGSLEAKTVATLPTAATSSDTCYLVTDGASATDCTVGSGSTRVICCSNGTAWSAPGLGAGGTIVGDLHINLGGVFIDAGQPLGLNGTGYPLLKVQTADADAKIAAAVFGEGGAEYVPVMVIGDATIASADLGFFNGITDPSFALISDDGGDYARFTVLDTGETDIIVGTAGAALAIKDGAGNTMMTVTDAGTTGNVAVTGTTTSSGLVTANANLDVKNGVNPGVVKLYEGSGGGTEYIGIDVAAALSASLIWTLPGTDAANCLFQSDGSGNLSCTTTLGVASIAVGSGYLSTGADPADAGAIRMSNADYIMAESDVAGTDISVIGVDASEVIQIGASGASGVTITPALTVTGAITEGGVGVLNADEIDASSELVAIMDDETGTGALCFATSPGFTTAANPVSADGATLGTASLEWSDLYLADGGKIYFQNDQSVYLTPSAGLLTLTGGFAVADVANDNYVKVTNNSGGRAPTASVYEAYPDAGVWKLNQNGTEYATVLAPTAGQVSFTGPTAARAYALPDRAASVLTGSACVALTPAAAVTLTVGGSNCYADTVTDNEDQTITFSGAGFAGEEATIIFTTAGTADEVITFHATLVSSTGTLTLGTDAGKFYVIRFISNGTHWYEVSRTAVQT